MPSQNRYAFLLGNQGDVAKNVSDIYAQLQAPGQRDAASASLNASVQQSAPTTSSDPREIVVGYRDSDVFGSTLQVPIYETIYETVVTPSRNPVTYRDAYAKAANASYAKTINPNDLVNLPGKDYQSSGYITNGYINPSAERAYDLTPVFNTSGQQLTGLGVNQRRTTETDRLLQDLEFGPSGKMYRYNNTLTDAAKAARFASENENASLQENIYRSRNRYDYDPDKSYKLFKSIAGPEGFKVAAATNESMAKSFYVNPDGSPTPFAQSIARYQASQTGLSKSFYGSGGHDNPTSFPAGYRL